MGNAGGHRVEPHDSLAVYTPADLIAAPMAYGSAEVVAAIAAFGFKEDDAAVLDHGATEEGQVDVKTLAWIAKPDGLPVVALAYSKAIVSEAFLRQALGVPTVRLASSHELLARFG